MAKRAKGTGTLRKRADGRWEGRLYLGKDENGKNQYKTVTNKKKSECQNKLDKLIAEEEKENAMMDVNTVIALILPLRNGIRSTLKIFAQDT